MTLSLAAKHICVQIADVCVFMPVACEEEVRRLCGGRPHNVRIFHADTVWYRCVYI